MPVPEHPARSGRPFQRSSPGGAGKGKFHSGTWSSSGVQPGRRTADFNPGVGAPGPGCWKACGAKPGGSVPISALIAAESFCTAQAALEPSAALKEECELLLPSPSP